MVVLDAFLDGVVDGLFVLAGVFLIFCAARLAIWLVFGRGDS